MNIEDNSNTEKLPGQEPGKPDARSGSLIETVGEWASFAVNSCREALGMKVWLPGEHVCVEDTRARLCDLIVNGGDTREGYRALRQMQVRLHDIYRESSIPANEAETRIRDILFGELALEIGEVATAHFDRFPDSDAEGLKYAPFMDQSCRDYYKRA